MVVKLNATQFTNTKVRVTLTTKPKKGCRERLTHT